jgi:uncharacterized cupin superfamily protein
MANVFEHELEADGDDVPPRYRGRFARIGREAGGERLGATLYEIPPGNTTAPYHWHAANEEMLIVLAGTPTLRTPEGERELTEGEVVAFRVGEGGAHKVSNLTQAPVRVIFISEMNAPDVCVYPDSGKVMARQQAPGREATGLRALFRLRDEVDYWDGEAEPEEGR